MNAQCEGAFFRTYGGDGAENNHNNSEAWETKQAETLPNIGAFGAKCGGAKRWRPSGVSKLIDGSSVLANMGHSTTYGVYLSASYYSSIYKKGARVTPVNYAVGVQNRAAKATSG